MSRLARSGRARAAARALLCCLAALPLARPLAAQLALRSGGRDTVWWRAEAAPAAWRAPLPLLTGAVHHGPAVPMTELTARLPVALLVPEVE